MNATVKKYAIGGLAIIGAWNVVGFAHNLAMTEYTRHHTNAISELENEWLRCSLIKASPETAANYLLADEEERRMCRDTAFERMSGRKNILQAACGITQAGNFHSGWESAHGGVWRVPSYYRFPLYTSLTACMKLLDNPSRMDPA